MASLNAAVLMTFAVAATLSCVLAQGDFGSVTPAPAPASGGSSFPVSGAVVASSLVLSLVALVMKY
ncbi:hypothetical protein OROMI_017822 [Orobanche minor]